jgi:hypothetical protein
MSPLPRSLVDEDDAATTLPASAMLNAIVPSVRARGTFFMIVSPHR